MGNLHLFLIRLVRCFKLTQLGDEAQLLFLLFFPVLLQDCTLLAHLRPKPIDTKVAAFFPRPSLLKKKTRCLCWRVCTVSVTFPPGGRRCPAASCSAPSADGCGCETPEVSEHLFFREIKCQV